MADHKILINSIFYAPEPIGIGKYTGELGEWLGNHGLDVRVVTAFPFYPHWRLYPGYPHWRYHRERIDLVDVIRSPLWVPSQVNGRSRVLHLLSFAMTNTPVTLAQAKWQPDLILQMVPTMVSIPAVIGLAKLCGSRTWLHVQDFEFDLASRLKLLGDRPKIAKWMRRFERLAFGLFDRVSTISEHMVERLIEEKGVPEEKAVLFPNWVDRTKIFPLEGPNPFRKELNISKDQVVLLYSGNMGRKYGLEMLAKAAQLLSSNPEIVFVFCGDGVARQDLVRACSGLQNVRFLPLQPEERLNELLNLADIHLLPQRVDAAESVMPSKLMGMLASGKPVIATVQSETEIAKVIEGSGLIVPSEQPAELVGSILVLSEDGCYRKKMGENGLEVVKKRFRKEVVLQSFEREIRLLLGKTRVL